MALTKTMIATALCGLMLAAPIAMAGEGVQDNKMEVAEHLHGDLMLKGAFARATLPNQPVAGAFLTISNTGSQDDVLVGVSADFAGRGEVHEMAMEGETMKMRELPDGLVIPAGETVELKPGGYHLMFMKLNEPLVEGDTVEATLEFQNAGSVTLPFSVQPKGAKGMSDTDQGS